jgi:hypothetical protein
MPNVLLGVGFREVAKSCLVEDCWYKKLFLEQKLQYIEYIILEFTPSIILLYSPSPCSWDIVYTCM